MSAYLFRKWSLGAFALLLLTITSPSFAQFYLGAIGGGGDSSTTNFSQRGFAFNNPDPRLALSVNARGNSGKFGAWLAGGNFGYDFDTGTCIVPGLEFESFYLRSMSGQKTGFIDNPTFFEHEFVDTLPLRLVTFFADAIFAFKIPGADWFEPYVGGGIGGAVVWISNANSAQLSPAEPGINHFNSKPSASSGAFTAQFKGGLRFNLSDHWRLFAEYRYLFIDSTDYIFGFTQYPQFGHAPTTNWLVHLGTLNYNIGTAGLQYKF